MDKLIPSFPYFTALVWLFCQTNATLFTM